MIFFKKQHEEIAVGFLKRIDLLLRSDHKSVAGYAIDGGTETLKLRVGKVLVEMKIEGQMWSYNEPDVPAEVVMADPNKVAEAALEETKEIVY